MYRRNPLCAAALSALLMFPCLSFGQAKDDPREVERRQLLEQLEKEISASKEHLKKYRFEKLEPATAEQIKEMEARIAEFQKRLDAMRDLNRTVEQMKKLPPLQFRIEKKDEGVRETKATEPKKDAPRAEAQKDLKALGEALKGLIIEMEVDKSKTVNSPGFTMSTFGPLGVGMGSHNPFAPAENVVHLMRATYRLPKEKADALTAFLKANVKVPVLEIGNEGEGLTVTTTPEAQATISGLVRLMHETAPVKLQFNFTMPMPREKN